MPGGLEKQPLLRIHLLCFNRSDLEKLRIELIDILEKASPFAWIRSNFLLIHIVKKLQFPAILLNFTNRILAIDQVRPELLQIVCMGITSAHSYNGD
ncbi:hypothetical protein D3C77_338830 [compost metagenome]